MSKENTRKRHLIIRNSLSIKDINEWTNEIQKKIINLDEFKKAQSVLFYYPFGSEVNTLKIFKVAIKQGKTALFPRIISETKKISVYKITDLKKEIEDGYNKIQEPKLSCELFSKDEIDLIIVPGVAFGEKGERLGYGMGYYDRFLKQVKGNLIGVCFERQITDKIIPEKHDVPVYKIVTEQRIIKCR